jgi:4-hydroxymandelate oxidase
LDDLLNLDDMQRAAEAVLPRGSFDYYAGGAGDEVTLHANRAAYAEVFLRPRVLAGLAAIDTRTMVLGSEVSMPVLLAPVAFQKLAHADGECATARAAGRAGTLMTVSTIASTALEDVAQAASGPLWFQLYVYRDRAITRELLRRAKVAGYRAIVLTVDTPVLGRRERDFRNGFRLPDGVRIANFAHLEDKVAGVSGWREGSSFWAYVHQLLDGSLDWKAVDWLRQRTDLPIVVKGVLHPDDARRAADAGAAGVVVSNHGGRQLDGAMATIDALPEVAAAADGRLAVLMDGGVRRGVDVVRALARGARAVLIGRPYLWALAAGGEQGVVAALDLLRREVELAMALCGCPRVAAIGSDLLAPHRAGS